MVISMALGKDHNVVKPFLWHNVRKEVASPFGEIEDKKYDYWHPKRNQKR
jgi:hypothetical protein